MTRMIVGTWLVAACGGDDAVERPGDTDSGTPAPVENRFTVLPEDGWVAVAPLQNVVVTATPGFASTSLDTTSVALVDEFGSEIPFSTRLEDGGRTFVIDPSRPLSLSGTYSVQIEGLAYVDDTALPAIGLTFETHPFPRITRSQRATSLEVSSYDDRQRVVTSDTFTDPGTDGIWGTQDDLQSERQVYEYEPERVLSYDGPGSDVTWATGDDELVWYETVEELPLLRTETRFERGLDGLWFTPDDVATSRREIVYDSDGLALSRIFSFGIGNDETWFTGDDDVLGFAVWSHSPTGQLVREVSYNRPGVDDTPFTDDDVVSSYYVQTFRPDGLRLRFTTYIDPGNDGVWLDGNDVPLSYVQSTYDENGLRTSDTQYADPGDDGEWFTSDDPIDRFTRVISNADGVETETITSSDPGPDQQWGTADDVVTSRWERTVDAMGFPVRFRTFDGPSEADLREDREYLPPLVAGPRSQP